MNLYPQDGGGIGGDFEAVVSTMTDQPDDVTLSIGDDQLAALLEEADLTVGQIVAHQTAALHTIRMETVARL